MIIKLFSFQLQARILFSTWNLDHLVERSRTVVPAIVAAFKVFASTVVSKVLITPS